MFKALHNSLLSLIYPQQCRLCNRQVIGLDGGVACSLCWSATHIFDGTEVLCDRCGAFLGTTAVPTGVHCRGCREHHYDRAVAVGVYEHALSAVTLELKRTPFIPAHLRSSLTSRFLSCGLPPADLIVPVPLSRQRQHERGFNQAEIIAEYVGKLTGAAIDNLSLARKRHTQAHRIAMDQRARELTVVNAFEVTRPNLIRDRSVLLVDDIFTSGATASSCARVLKKSGAASVNVFTLARAVMH